jgi:hypothetical protein
MRRSVIGLITTLVLVILVALLAADAQPVGKVPRIGYDKAPSPSPRRYAMDFGKGCVTSAMSRARTSLLSTDLMREKLSCSVTSPPSWCVSGWTCSSPMGHPRRRQRATRRRRSPSSLVPSAIRLAVGSSRACHGRAGTSRGCQAKSLI